MKLCILIITIFIVLVESVKDDQEFINKFKVQIIRNGTQNVYPEKGQKIKAHFVGTLNDGTKLLNTKKDNHPLSFGVGNNQVIKCWDEVLLKLGLGDVVAITCPSELSYGKSGAGSVIPPDAELNFEIELLEIAEIKYEEL